MSIGYTTIRVLPDLTGKPWCPITEAFVSALRPSRVEVIHHDAVVKSDARTWRVRVHLDERGRIDCIEQEVEVTLPDGVEHGHDLQCRLEKLESERPRGESERLAALVERACKVADGLVDLAAPGLDTFRDLAITDVADIRDELAGMRR